ncbi:CPBP family intramembrane metalloprotease [Sphingomonas changnyeongensis]|uniref:CPBP family intramembrane metalloprotease n=1 Tax=Sphingomonas changnyeongensis TaxID=2698679 RepID=A0A7Z2NUV9_9SPHN|nr:CPBP family intramembrane glutamic endopeptidase [Sphingomonas changnyeongensis]QHL89844.1 CPBP family intramembrane metalloprotease [Sphingomonas changnyeongensis]
MNGLIGLAGTLAVLLLLGTMLGCADRRNFAPRWLIIAALMVAFNDALLTRCYGLVPDLIGGEWNWQGKLAALLATIAIAGLPALGFRRAGFTLSHEPGSMTAALPVAAIYCAFFMVIAMAFPADRPNAEHIAFQLTMPGLEEEPFYRGILLLALDQAFRGRKRVFGVDWGWGAVLSCVLFGMAHAFGYSSGGFSLDPVTMALTGIPSLIAIWLRLRTGSLLLPIALHNFGNAFSLLV